MVTQEELRPMRAAATALIELEFSLRYTLRQWEGQPTPRDFDRVTFVRDLLAIIEQARERSLAGGWS